eukprot:569329_1
MESASSVSRSYNVHKAINNNSNIDVSPSSNLVTISGNIKGRTMSDYGGFTKCICQSFGKNVDRRRKADFNSLCIEIGNNLEKKTKHAELCSINGTIRYNPVRFEPWKLR